MPDFAAQAKGEPVIPARRARTPGQPGDQRRVQILRRGYSYTDGMDPVTGQLDAGLFFLAYQKDPAAFITLQRRLGVHDALNEYIKHTGSALFACPPGVAAGARLGGRPAGLSPRSASHRSGRPGADFVRVFTSA